MLSLDQQSSNFVVVKQGAVKCLDAIYCLLPEWTRYGISNQVHERAPNNGRAAYLDGLRGVASLFVFVRHFILPWYRAVDYGYYQTPDLTSFLRLPVIRVLYSGPNVPIFLVVSGYVVSLKPLSCAHKGNQHLALESLASSTLRRGFRVFGPPLFMTFVVMLLTQLGMFDFSYATMPGHVPTHPQRASSLMAQVYAWGAFIHQDLLNPWKWSTGRFVYGPHLWTVPLQFRCSMVLSISLVSLTPVRPPLRMLLLPMMVIACFLGGRWDVALYLYGMLLAEIDISWRKSGIEDVSMCGSRSRMRGQHGNVPAMTMGGCLILGLYFASFPRHSGPTASFGYGWTDRRLSTHH